VGSLLPLRGRKLTRAPISLYGMVVAHFGIGVALFGMACDSAFSVERLVAARVGETVSVGPWAIKLSGVAPVAGQNWTAMEATLQVRYKDGAVQALAPQSRTFWTPLQTTAVSALLSRWNGQLYTVLGEEVSDGRWQLRLWWKPFVTMIWFGGILVALGGALALVSRVAQDLKRRRVRIKGDFRRDALAKLEQDA
jgi:cytochrome c-type biogenesis protein CcmF